MISDAAAGTISRRTSADDLHAEQDTRLVVCTACALTVSERYSPIIIGDCHFQFMFYSSIINLITSFDNMHWTQAVHLMNVKDTEVAHTLYSSLAYLFWCR